MYTSIFVITTVILLIVLAYKQSVILGLRASERYMFNSRQRAEQKVIELRNKLKITMEENHEMTEEINELKYGED